MTGQTICNRCALDAGVPGVSFDASGTCNHCRLHDMLDQKYALNAANRKGFEKLLETVKRKGRGKKYDCIVGLSGGLDSTYCLYVVKQLGLRPLAFHYDNGWVTDVAKRNIEKAVEILDVDLKVVSHPWQYLKKIYRACLKASIPETCMPCEVGIVSALYEVAVQEQVTYIVLGTSFRTEGINPLRWHYLDGAYFNDVVKKFGVLDAETKEFNKLTMPKLFNYIFLKGIKTFQLPLYIEYRNEKIITMLKDELHWEHGGRAHFDCCYKPFGGYLDRMKFNRDPSKISLSALVRSGEMTRGEALEKIQAAASAPVNLETVDYCMQRLDLSPKELQSILREPPKTFLDYSTYYPFFSRLRMPLKACCKVRLLPETMYEKFFTVV